MRHNSSSRRSWLPPAQRTEEPHGFSTLPSCHLFLHPIALSVTACRVDGLTIIGQARYARAIRRVHSRFSRGRDTRTHNAKTRLERRVCIVRSSGKLE